MIDEGLVGLIGMVLLYIFGQIFLPDECNSMPQKIIIKDVGE